MVASPATLRSLTPPPPRRVGRYELLEELGRGGMASVYLARCVGSEGFERLAAVKLLHRAMCADPDFVEMFLDEARVAARLHHPNATAIVDVGAEGMQLYMVMDYVEGDTLHAVQCAAVSLRRAVPLGIALRVVLDALAGLDAAHELRWPDGTSLGLIHRDVTPHNVLIGVDGVARLVDFGIARAAGRAGVTTVGVLKGKVPFMAPEQIRGRAVDRRADIFSMGVTLWETMALRRCFPLRDGALLSRLANEPYRPLFGLAPNVPDALDAICRRALAFEPDDRYSTAAEFAQAIEESFRDDLATQRELGQFMSVVAATKLKGEREAVRASLRPVAPRSMRPTVRPSAPPRTASALDLRPPRVPTFSAPPASAGRAPIDDSLVDSEDVTSIVHTIPPPPPAAKERRPLTLPPLPRPTDPLRSRASLPPPSSLPRPPARPEGNARPIALDRPKPSLAPPPPPVARASVPAPRFFPDPAEDLGRVSEVRVVVPQQKPATPVWETPLEASVLLKLPAIGASRPSRAPRPVTARPKGWLRSMAHRIYARLFRAG